MIKATLSLTFVLMKKKVEEHIENVLAIICYTLTSYCLFKYFEAFIKTL